MKKRVEKAVIVALLVSIGALYAADDERAVVSFEVEDVLSTEPEVGFTDYVSLGAHLSLRQIWSLSRSQAKLKKEYEKIATDTPGKGNAFRLLAPVMQRKYNVNITYLIPKLLELSINPNPHECYDKVKELIRTLKERDILVVAATHQDYKHHKIHRRKREEESEFEWKKLFDATIVTEYKKDEEQTSKEEASDGYIQKGDSLYIVQGASNKTSPQYWDVVAAIAQRSVGQNRRFRGIHIDPDQRVVEVVNKRRDFEGVHFQNDCRDVQRLLGIGDSNE